MLGRWGKGGCPILRLSFCNSYIRKNQKQDKTKQWITLFCLFIVHNNILLYEVQVNQMRIFKLKGDRSKEKINLAKKVT